MANSIHVMNVLVINHLFCYTCNNNKPLPLHRNAIMKSHHSHDKDTNMAIYFVFMLSLSHCAINVGRVVESTIMNL